MAKLAVILGAGASYDVCPDPGPILKPDFRPPLLKEMFKSPEFDAAFDQYPRAHTIMSEVRTAARGTRPIAFEERLALLSKSNDRDIRKCVLQVPLALQTYFQKISVGYTREAINYSALITKLHLRGIQTAFATLNYDTLLEQSIHKFSGGIGYDNFKYTSGDNRWLVAKLHGSIDWGYRWFSPGQFDSHRLAAESLDYSDVDTSKLVIRLGPQLRDNDYGYYPALAMPVSGKYGFICSKNTQNDLRSFVRECQNYLFIGFSGQDQDLLDFLAENVLRSEGCVEIVAGKDADSIKEALLKSIDQFTVPEVMGGIRTHTDGFTSFLENEADAFLDRVAANGNKDHNKAIWGPR